MWRSDDSDTDVWCDKVLTQTQMCDVMKWWLIHRDYDFKWHEGQTEAEKERYWRWQSDCPVSSWRLPLGGWCWTLGCSCPCGQCSDLWSWQCRWWRWQRCCRSARPDHHHQTWCSPLPAMVCPGLPGNPPHHPGHTLFHFSHVLPHFYTGYFTLGIHSSTLTIFYLPLYPTTRGCQEIYHITLVGWVLLYIHRRYGFHRPIRVGRPEPPPQLSHSSWALITLDTQFCLYT